jgi:hypothetical protein
MSFELSGLRGEVSGDSEIRSRRDDEEKALSHMDKLEQHGAEHFRVYGALTVEAPPSDQAKVLKARQKAEHVRQTSLTSVAA